MSPSDRSVTWTTSIPSTSEPSWPKSWRAYACWLGCFFLMFNSWGLVNAYGTFASYYVAHSLAGEDQLVLNLIGSTQSFLVLLFSAPVGRLLDAGHFRWVIGTGCLLTPLGMFMLSITTPNSPTAEGNYGYIWATQGFVTGLGMACYFVSSSQVVATWFPHRKGLAIGFVACGASIAGGIYPTIVRYLVTSIGFNSAVRLVATVVTITSIFSFIFATPDPKHNHPQPQSWRAMKTWIDMDAFQNKSFCWFMAAIAFLFFGFYPVFFNLEEWAAKEGYGTRSHGMKDFKFKIDDGSVVVLAGRDPIQTFWLLSIMNGSSTVGRICMAAFSDKVGPLNMHIGTTAVSSLLILLVWSFAHSTTATIAFCVFFGGVSGAVIGLPPASVSNILSNSHAGSELQRNAPTLMSTTSTSNPPPPLSLNDTNNDANTIATSTTDTPHPHAKLGQWIGMLYTGAAIPSLTGPVIVGHLISRYDNYLTVQIWSGVCLMLSAACMAVARFYLPCQDGASTIAIFKIWAREKARMAKGACGKGGGGIRVVGQAPTRVGSQAPSQTASTEKVGGVSQAPTRVGSEAPSRSASVEKVCEVEAESEKVTDVV